MPTVWGKEVDTPEQREWYRSYLAREIDYGLLRGRLVSYWEGGWDTEVDQWLRFMQAIVGGTPPGMWPWPLSYAQPWFQSLWNNIVGWTWSAAGWVRDQVWDRAVWLRDRVWENVGWLRGEILGRIDATAGWIRDRVWEKGGEILGDIWGKALWVKDRVWEKGEEILGRIDGATGSILSGVWTRGQDVLNDLWSKSVWIRDQVGGLLSGAEGRLKDTIAGLRTDLAGTLAGIPGSVIGALTPWVRGILPSLGGKEEAHSLLMWYFYTQEGWRKEMIPGWIGDGVRTAIGWATKDVSGTLQPLASLMGEKVITALKPAGDWVINQVQTGVGGLLTTLEKSLGLGTPITPEAAYKNALTAIATTFAASMGIALILDLAQTKVLGSGVELRTMTGQLQAILPLLIPGTVLTSALYGAALKQPLGYFFNNAYRPLIPEPGILDQMLFYQALDAPGWKRWYGYHGWSDTWIDAWYKCVWKTPGIQDLITFRAWGKLEEPAYFRNARQLGFEEVDAKSFWETRFKLPALDQIWFGLWSGMKDDTWAKSTLALLLYRPEDYELLKAAAYRQPSYRELDLIFSDHMPPDTWIESVVARGGFPPEFRTELVKALKLRALRDVRSRLLTVGIKRRKEGYELKPWFEEIIKKLNYRPDLQAIIVEATELEWLTDYQADQLKAADLAYEKGQCNFDEFEAQVKTIIKDPARLEKHLELERYKVLPKPKATAF